MKVSDKMTRAVRLVSPDDSIQQVAHCMAECDAGAMPVAAEGHLVGMVTDRDIAVRAVAQGRGPDTKAREVMTQEVKYCFEDQDLDEVARNMAEQQLRRLPVVTHDKRLVGILSLGDIAMAEGSRPAGDALAGISRPGGAHSQTGGARM
ncbi:MAG: CBS domain-containing protein [Acetobacteraceae bacterium]|nr:CBS domain-containing protein [Acetobacteraceae bacterium]